MSDAPPPRDNRWTGEEMQKRVAGATPPSADSAFSVSPPSACRSLPRIPARHMAWKAWVASAAPRPSWTIDFPRSDLFIDQAALRGPQAQEVVGTAGLEGVLEQAAIAQFGEGAEELFGGASASLGDQLIADPDLLTKGRAMGAAVVERRCRGQGRWRSGARKLVAKAETRRVFNGEFLTAPTRPIHRSSACGGRSRAAS